MKKFYVGAKHIGHSVSKGQDADCMRASFDEAVEHAQEYLERDTTINTCVIVEVVGIVQRQKPPVKVTRLNRKRK